MSIEIRIIAEDADELAHALRRIAHAGIKVTTVETLEDKSEASGNVYELASRRRSRTRGQLHA